MDRSRSQPSLYRFFAGLTEYVFQTRLGVVDPPLVDYLSVLLARFVRCDAIYDVRDLAGRRLEEVAQMLFEAQARVGDARREVHRHIGDFTLFWSGVYPESLRRLKRESRLDHLVDYREQGKRAYLIASTIASDANRDENEVLERLSHEFELCAYGLGELRREWERREPAEAEERPGPWLIE
ncbi:MAG: hypothetical protein HYX69_23390 [Planctomycetia bacterium]|nr:hypothetical protein [Planctomycetia bacterium]